MTAPPVDDPNHREPEETLDPDDWSAHRRLAHRMLDDMFDHLQGAGTRPAWQPVPAAVKEADVVPLPLPVRRFSVP